MSKNGTVTVHIVGKDYQIACPEGQESALKESAAYLHTKMSEIRRSGKVLGIERIAVMAALNISHELLQSDSSANNRKKDEQLQALNTKIDEAMDRFRQLEIN